MVRKAALLLAAMLAITSWSIATAGATGSWSLVKSPNGIGQFAAQLSGVSCLSASTCVAVGSMQDPVRRESTLIESFDGSRWVRQPSPNAAGLQQSTLEAVSCASARSCLAVGASGDGAPSNRRLAERWNGFQWSIENTPSPSGAEQTRFHGVACVTALNCTITGESINAAFEYAPLIEHWNGTAWSIASTANPPGAADGTLSSVACTGPSSCVAVGSSSNGTMIERWDGSSWTFVASPNAPGTNTSTLSDVSCTAASNCIAVGNAYSDTSIAPLIERWNGSTWQRMLAADDAPLHAVSCASSTDCITVGGAGDSFAEHYNGSTWTTTSVPPNPNNDDGFLGGVACISTTSCTAVGGALSLNPGTTAVADRWNGSTWSTIATVDQTGAVLSELTGIACPAEANCIAVGKYGAQNDQPLAEHWDGSTWSLQQTRSPAGSFTAGFAGVACPSPSRCLAVGRYASDYTEHFQPLAEIWNGSTWSLQTARKPTGVVTSALNAVSCPSTTVCFAVGSSTTSETQHGLVERWNGSTWSIQTIAPLPGSGTSTLSSITCVTTSNCIAVGAYDWSDSSGPRSLIERWNGHTWTMQASPDFGIVLNSVTCTSASNCFSVGSGLGVGAPPIAHWNGTAWASQSSTVNKDRVHFLHGVACISANDCNAVGAESERDYLFPVGFVDHWNGTTWSEAPLLPVPPTLDSATVASVACIAGQCTAVGGASSVAYGGSVTYVVQSARLATPPGAPTLTGIRSGNAWVSVAWSAPSSSGSSAISSYVVTTSPGGQTITVPATARRAVVPVPNGTTQTAHVQAVNDAGPGDPSNDSTTFTPAVSTITVTTQYNATDNTRLLKNATYFGQNAVDAQRTSVGIIAYIVGLVHSPTMTPVAPPVSTGPNSYTTPWSAGDQGALVSVMRQYSLTPSETQYFSTQLIGYLLAVGGN